MTLYNSNMLKKQVCWLCFTLHFKPAFITAAKYDFDKLWYDYKTVSCWYAQTGLLQIHHNPPDKCPYILEHIIR